MTVPTEEERERAGYWWEAHGAVDDPGERNGYAYGLAANRVELAEARGRLAACELTGQAMMNERDALKVENDRTWVDVGKLGDVIKELTAERDALREALHNLCDNPNSDYFEMAARVLLNKETL